MFVLHRSRILALPAALLLVIPNLGAAPTAPPENLARHARATASSEHNGSYAARFAVDGKIPFAGSQEDTDRAWCVQGNTHRQGAEFTLEWTNAVTVAEIVYYGRTAWFAEECWQDYEVRLDDAPTPVARGQLQMGHGPQRIRLAAPALARKLTLRFTSSYGGLNPGASEIQIFSEAPAASALAKFRPLPKGRPELVDDEIVESPQLRARLMAGLLGFDKLLLIQRRELNPSHVYTYHVEGFGAGGGLYVGDLLGKPANPQSAIRNPQLTQLVASPDGQILDCDLSYDAKEILFSWRRKQSEGYHVFTINTDGSNLRQLTDGPHHNYNACWLPDGGIAFLSTRTSRFAYCWVSPVGVLHRMERDGSRVTQLSANIVNDFTPSVLDDGRIIYSRWEYVDKPAIPIQSLWTIHPDGTGLAGFFGNRVLSPATFMEARSIPGRRGVLCVLTSHNGPARGAVGIVDIAWGNNASQGIQNLTPEVAIGQTDKGDGNNIRGPYESPYPLDGECFLVSKRGTVIVRNYAGTEAAKIITPRDGLGFYSPQPLRPRKKPPVLATQIAPSVAQTSKSAVSQVSKPAEPRNAGRPADSEVGDTAGLETCATKSADEVAWATVVLQDVYRGLEPQVKRGEVKEIAVIEEMRKAVRTDVANRAFGFQFPVISCGATYAGKTIWGYAPVAADGSACFQVPAGRPIYFMALDAEGRAVQRMRTFTHLMPGEVQGCVGCHEPRQSTAASGASFQLATVSPTLRVGESDSPPSQAGKLGTPRKPEARATTTTSAARPSVALAPPEWGERVGFDYSAIVQPVLDRHCVSCHSGVSPADKVDLCGDKTDFFNVSYEVLARGRKRSGEAEWDSPFVNWIPTYNGMEANILEVTPKAWGSPRSKLADILLSGHPDTNGTPRLKMEARETRRVLAWIDLNVPYYGTSETAYPEKKGCRQMLPADLDKTLADVAKRRCAECHQGGKFRREFWTRIQNPQMNNFLLAPLAKEAGGSGACGKAVFASQDDADYQAIVRTFDPVLLQLRLRPRMDMPGAKPADVDRSCLGKVD